MRQADDRDAARHAPDRARRPDRQAHAGRRGPGDRRASSTWASCIDRAAERPVMMVSPAGGMEIEKVAAETPDRIYKEHVDPAIGLVPFQARKLGVRLGLDGAHGEQGREGDDARSTTRSSAPTRRWSRSTRSSSPRAGDLLALDAKMNFDDNALFRHPDITRAARPRRGGPARDRGVEVLAQLHPPRRRRSAAWSTAPASRWRRWTSSSWRAASRPTFSTSAAAPTRSRSRTPFRILMSDTNVRAVFINIFGGILRCDILAEGVIAAVKELGVPAADRHPDGGHQRRGREAHAARERPELHDGRRDGPGRARSREAGAIRAQDDGRDACPTTGNHDMAVLIDKSTRLVVQGLTGREGTFHAKPRPPTARTSSAG